MRFPRKSPVARTALGLLALGLASACVSQNQYDDAVATAKSYEKRYYDLDAQSVALRDENRRLKRQLDAAKSATVEASAEFDESLEARLAELNQIIGELGANPGDATKFKVDGGVVYRVKDAVLFGFASAEVSPEGHQILQRIAGDINAERGRVFVRGHTDNVPVKKAATLKKYPMGNIHLSVDRALNVAQVLTREGGVPDSRIIVMGFGPNEPVAANDSEANRRRNRRVEIFVATEEEGFGG